MFVNSISRFVCLAGALALAAPALAQDKGTLNPKPLPPLANPEDPATPAKALFGRKTAPADLEARAIGFYAKGCLAGGEALPINGPAWQVMRLSRNRNWGHPDLIAFLEKFAKQVPSVAGWPGLLVGDISQPRGGPMITGHNSHQIGLDADIWLTPMPRRELSRTEREEMSATDMVRADKLDVNENWTAGHTAVIRAAAKDPQVQRIFVNPAIKKELCREAGGDRAWLNKVRPMYGHNYHFHVRVYCPRDSQEVCDGQDPVPPGDGCDQLAYWFSDAVLHPKPRPPGKSKPPMTMSALPGECRTVLKAQ